MKQRPQNKKDSISQMYPSLKQPTPILHSILQNKPVVVTQTISNENSSDVKARHTGVNSMHTSNDQTFYLQPTPLESQHKGIVINDYLQNQHRDVSNDALLQVASRKTRRARRKSFTEKTHGIMVQDSCSSLKYVETHPNEAGGQIMDLQLGQGFEKGPLDNMQVDVKVQIFNPSLPAGYSGESSITKMDYIQKVEEPKYTGKRRQKSKYNSCFKLPKSEHKSHLLFNQNILKDYKQVEHSKFKRKPQKQGAFKNQITSKSSFRSPKKTLVPSGVWSYKQNSVEVPNTGQSKQSQKTAHKSEMSLLSNKKTYNTHHNSNTQTLSHKKSNAFPTQNQSHENSVLQEIVLESQDSVQKILEKDLQKSSTDANNTVTFDIDGTPRTNKKETFNSGLDSKADSKANIKLGPSSSVLSYEQQVNPVDSKIQLLVNMKRNFKEFNKILNKKSKFSRAKNLETPQDTQYLATKSSLISVPVPDDFPSPFAESKKNETKESKPTYETGPSPLKPVSITEQDQQIIDSLFDKQLKSAPGRSRRKSTKSNKSSQEKVGAGSSNYQDGQFVKTLTQFKRQFKHQQKNKRAATASHVQAFLLVTPNRNAPRIAPESQSFNHESTATYFKTPRDSKGVKLSHLYPHLIPQKREINSVITRSFINTQKSEVSPEPTQSDQPEKAWLFNSSKSGYVNHSTKKLTEMTQFSQDNMSQRFSVTKTKDKPKSSPHATNDEPTIESNKRTTNCVTPLMGRSRYTVYNSKATSGLAWSYKVSKPKDVEVKVNQTSRERLTRSTEILESMPFQQGNLFEQMINSKLLLRQCAAQVARQSHLDQRKGTSDLIKVHEPDYSLSFVSHKTHQTSLQHEQRKFQTQMSRQEQRIKMLQSRQSQRRKTPSKAAPTSHPTESSVVQDTSNNALDSQPYLEPIKDQTAFSLNYSNLKQLKTKRSNGDLKHITENDATPMRPNFELELHTGQTSEILSGKTTSKKPSASRV